MKWVKVAIGAVIAIAVVPMIALSVFNLTQEKTREEVVTFEVLTESTVTPGTYSKINEYAIFNNDFATNLLSITFNGTSNGFTTPAVVAEVTNYIVSDYADDEPYIMILNNDTIDDKSESVLVGAVWVITFEVTTPPILNGVTATLLLLAPLIFVSGILYFIYNNKQEGI